MIELSDWFNNPSLIEFGSIKIQYYAISWLLSAVLIYFFLKRNKIITTQLFMYNVLIRFIIQIMLPNKLRKWFFINLFRKI